jgi:hypothetical protein
MTTVRAACLGASVCIGLLLPGEAGAQARPLPATAPESLAALRSVLEAKQLFRQMHTLAVAMLRPWPKGGIGRWLCDVKVEGTDYCAGPFKGNLVFFHRDPMELKADFSFWRYGKAAEKPKWRALKLYLEAIEKAAAIIPGDRWIATERVSIFIEHVLRDSVIAASHKCGADEAYCAALQAYSLNEVGQHARADSVWTTALA